MTVRTITLIMLAMTVGSAAPQADRAASEEHDQDTELAVPRAAAQDIPLHEPRSRRSRTYRSQPHRSSSFEIATASLGRGRWAAIRYNTTNGTSWITDAGRWRKLKEFRQLSPHPNSLYVIEVVETEPGRFGAIRLDQNSGDAWELNDDIWQPILDPAD